MTFRMLFMTETVKLQANISMKSIILRQDGYVHSSAFNPNDWKTINHEEIILTHPPCLSPEEKEDAHEEQGWNHSEKDQHASSTCSLLEPTL
jgi:hypothetical protein